MSDKTKLGEEVPYPQVYSPECLDPIPRSASRDELFELSAKLPFSGQDIWTAYEVSWLESGGKPVVAMARFSFDYRSTYIVESKSFKYYLNSFNQSVFANASEVASTMQRDLSAASGCNVDVVVKPLDQAADIADIGQPDGQCIDDLTLNEAVYHPDAALLKTDTQHVVNKAVYSHLLKSNCPVTNQPDWATLWVSYTGAHILEQSLLAYIVSYRQHQDFHENCVERIFCDILAACQPEELTVYARYTRRGGLDINPFRTNSSTKLLPPAWRIARQ